MPKAEIIQKTQNSEEEYLQKGIQYLIENSEAFSFLRDEEELYTLDDLKEKF
jgi:hypothetical protein